MVITPWGDSGTLREGRLPPGPGRPRAEVQRNQRERLFAAMVAVASEKGYAQTSANDLAQVSGVSSRTFYNLFGDKETCFLATLEEILTPAQAITAAKMRQEGSWEERARGAMRTFVKLLVDQPAAARMCLVEAYAAGPAATRKIDETLASFEELMQLAFAERPGQAEMPTEMTKAMMGGLRKIIHTRLHRGSEGELTDLLPDLLDLGLTYEPPPEALRTPRLRRGRTERGETRRRGEDSAERIIRATMEAVAAKGYQATTISDIVEAAGASLNTFYANFEDKEDAFDAALYSGRTRMLGVLLPALRRARNWPEGVRALTQASLNYMAEEPEFAQLVTVDVYAAGPEALERRDLAIERMLVALDGGVEYATTPMRPIAREAIMSAIYAMLSDWVQTQGTESLPRMAPLATYMALAPFIGPEDACKVANGEAWERHRPES
jgi:AcrR family transcriptional regulator